MPATYLIDNHIFSNIPSPSTNACPYAALKPLWISWSGCTASTAVGGGILYPESPYSHHNSGTRISSSLRALSLTAVVACRTEVATWGAASHMWCPGVSVPCPCLLLLSLVPVSCLPFSVLGFLRDCRISGRFPVAECRYCHNLLSLGLRCAVLRITTHETDISHVLRVHALVMHTCKGRRANLSRVTPEVNHHPNQQGRPQGLVWGTGALLSCSSRLLGSVVRSLTDDVHVNQFDQPLVGKITILPEYGS